MLLFIILILAWECHAARVLAPFWSSKAETTTFNYSTARQYMFLARASYCDKSVVEPWECGRPCAASAVEPGTVRFIGPGKVNKVQGFVAVRPGGDKERRCVVSFRGTEVVENQVADARFRPKRWPACAGNCKVHSGIVEAYEELEGEVFEALTNLSCARMEMVGYSLGAGVAAFAAYRIRTFRNQVVDPVYLFGGPRTGNKVWADAFVHAAEAHGTDPPAWRVVAKLDPVPHLPPLSLGFWHFPKEVHFERDKVFKLCDAAKGEDPKCSARFELNPQLWNLSHHMSYLQVVFNGTKGTDCVKKPEEHTWSQTAKKVYDQLQSERPSSIKVIDRVSPFNSTEAQHFAMFARAIRCNISGLRRLTCFPGSCDESVVGGFRRPLGVASLPVQPAVRFLGPSEAHKARGFVVLHPGGEAAAPRRCTAAFYATRRSTSWGAQLITSPVEWHGCTGMCRVHPLFSQMYEDLENELFQAMVELQCETVGMAGYSVGAAIASFASFRLRTQLGLRVEPVYLFGSPRTGNDVWASQYMRAASDTGTLPGAWRLVSGMDPVPHLPPTFSFTHFPREVYYENASNLSSFRVCDNSGEDAECSIKHSWIGLSSHVDDHKLYSNLHMSFKGRRKEVCSNVMDLFGLSNKTM